MAPPLPSEESRLEALAERLSGSALTSCLLRALRELAARRRPSDLLAQYGRDRFCAPALVDLRVALAIDQALLEAAAEFEAIELSPVAPLGACSVVAPTDQNRVLSALRNTEVVADSTNSLALECARRLRDSGAAPVHLVTSQRVVRAQPVGDAPGHTQHFRLFALGSGGRERVDHGFSVETCTLHLRSLLSGLRLLEQSGYRFGERRVQLLGTPRTQPLARRIAASLDVEAQLDALEHPYYSGGLRYRLWVTARDGEDLPIADGGLFDWLAQLTSNRRAVFVATGLGSQLVASRFR